jgi:hypothetical protein
MTASTPPQAASQKADSNSPSGEAVTWHSIGLDLAHAFRNGDLSISACGIGPGRPRASHLARCGTCLSRLRLR